MKAKTKLLGGGGQNPKAVAAGEVEFGLSIIPDILVVPGVEVLGPLPQELQHYVIETAVVSKVKEHTAADALLTFLKGPRAAAALNASGFEPISH